MTLGSVGKAVASQFQGSRKLLLVPLVAAFKVTAFGDDEELGLLVARYWEEAGQQVRGVEASVGLVAQVYHQGSVEEGDQGLASLEKGGSPAFALVKETCLRGARLRPSEDLDALIETVDLQRCLMMGLASPKVAGQVSEWYRDAEQRRYAAVAQCIDTTLEKDQVGLLVIAQDHHVQFPQDVQVIYVAPPSLNDVTRWFRDHPPGATPPPAEEPRPAAEDEGPSAADESPPDTGRAPA